MKRRKFIRNLGMGAAAIAATGVAGCSGEKAEPEFAQTTPPTELEGIQKYTEIGNTGLKMSDISMGCGGLDNPYIVISSNAHWSWASIISTPHRTTRTVNPK